MKGNICALFAGISMASILATSTPAFADTIYTVKPGDCLWNLAMKYQTSVQTLKTINHLSTNTIYVGQNVRVPSNNGNISISTHVPNTTSSTNQLVHIVKQGDTLWQLASSYGTTIQNIKDCNGLQTDTIYIGQHLLIPNKAVTNTVEPQKVPDSLVSLYKAAGEKYNVPWNVLAAIHKVETGFSTDGNLVSDAGARGPMQFLPNTFAQYGVTAPGHYGQPDIRNVYDAVYTTAHMLAENGYSANAYKALYAYNPSNQYVNMVISYANDLYM